MTKTSLAGTPIRIVNALNKYTKYSARIVDFVPIEMYDKSYKFPEDLDLKKRTTKLKLKN